jgi:plasmid maintenance system antidote protein VapI
MNFHDFIAEYFGTVRAFAQFIGVTYSTAYLWRKNPERITADRILKISRHTGVSECEIIETIKNSKHGRTN